MRQAMAEAPVGDDQYGADPTVNALQEYVADILGKEDALFVVSGTMANQIALQLLTRRGEEVITGKEAHVGWHEAGAGAAFAGVQFQEVGDERGIFTPDDLNAGFKPADHPVLPATTLVVVENTHNRASGTVFPADLSQAVAERAKQLGMAAYLDGARLFNASVACDVDVAHLSAPFDLVSISLSKGLGAPIGSVIAGSQENIKRAIRIRRMLGGAWRQAGLMAAAGLFALQNNVERLKTDHENARLFAEELADCNGLKLDMERVQTNIVVFEITKDDVNARELLAELKSKGVMINTLGGQKLRAVTHMNVSQEETVQAAKVIKEIISLS